MGEKEKRLYEFYKQCIDKGYSDMQDATESLKAKVIATDLGIKYKEIAQTYQEAKGIYEKEEKRIEHEKMLQNIPGEFLLSLIGRGRTEKISLYLRTDGSLYHTVNNDSFKHEGFPGLDVESGGVLLYTHHPSKAVFTGAVSGGVAMGGIHHTKAYVDEKVSNTGTGDIKIVSGAFRFTLKEIEVSDFIINKFKRQEWFKNNLSDGRYIYCYKTDGSLGKDILMKTALSQENYYDKMSMVSMAVDSERLSMEECKNRIYFLNDIFAKNYPDSDQTIYEKALGMENASTSEKLKQCIEIYETILDYKDVKNRVIKVQEKYEEVLQHEKEQAILQREAKEEAKQKQMKTIGKILPVVVVVVIVVVIALVMIGEKNKKESTYQSAIIYMEEANYETAIPLFKELEDYNDSLERLEKCCVLWYEQANQYVEEENFEQAIECFQGLEDLSESLPVSEETQRKLSKSTEMIETLTKKQNIKLAIEYRDVEYLMSYVDEFKKLSGEEIKETVVGKWNMVSERNRSAVARYDYEADGTVISYDGVSDGTVLTYTYEIVGDCIKIIGVEYEMYEIGDGYYLRCSTGSSSSGSLYWRRGE